MGETTLLYALSTLAQTCAALVALVGALGLYRLKSLEERGQEAERNLRGVLSFRESSPHSMSQILATSQIIERARTLVRRYREARDPGIGEDITKQLEDHLRRWDSVGPDQRRTGRLLILFGGWNLGAILLALLGFNFLPYLKDRWWASWILGVTATGAVLVTGLMILELLGAFPFHLDRAGLRRVRIWLERKYRA